MVHKKYSYRDGKKYGPYFYENKRVGEKVVTSYLGKNNPAHKVHKFQEGRRKSFFWIWILLGIIAISLMFYLFSPVPVSQSGKISPTGRVTVETQLVYEFGEPI